MNDELRFEVDHTSGLIRVIGTGIWSVERAETHFRNLDRAVQNVRQAHGKVNVLVDLRGAAVQPSETAAVIHDWTMRIYRAADRVAVVCATSLLALQMRRGVNIAPLATFHEIEPALRWIHE